MNWRNSPYRYLPVQERIKLGLPGSAKQYDADADMLTEILQEYFVNIVIRVLRFDEMKPYFEDVEPWFYRVQASLYGLQFYYDMPFEQWYETKDKNAFLHIMYGVIRDRLMAHITQQDVNKWRFV